MKLKEDEFLDILRKKAAEQRAVIDSGILPEWASFVGVWFGVNPWRVLCVLSVFVYLFCRFLFGMGFREFILRLFGGL